MNEFKNGKLTKFIYSQKAPEQTVDENGIVKVVGYTYNKLVLSNTGKDVVLFLCTASSKKCKLARERYVRAAKKLTGNSNLVFADIDTSYNEFNYIKYEKLPSIVLVPGFESSNDRVANIKLFEGEIYTNSIVDWVKAEAKNKVEKVEALENEELVFKQEAKKPIKAVDKEREEDITSVEEGASTGLRRTVISELDKDNEDFDQEDEKELDDILKEEVEKEARKAEKKKAAVPKADL